MSIHSLLAIQLKAPEMELDKEEALKLEKAIKAVQSHYPLNVSQKHLDIGMLIYAAGSIYGTRAVAIMARKKGAKKSAASQNDPDKVLRVFPGVGMGV